MKQIIRIKDQNSRFPVDARELHRKLKTGSRFNDWMKYRINQYGFSEGLDYKISFTEISVKPQGGRPSADYNITLDMAKELALVENNEAGRAIRYYFIHAERMLREGPFGDVARRNIDGREFLDYKAVLTKLAYSTRSGSFHARIRRYRPEFVNIDMRWYVSVAFARMLYLRHETERLRCEAGERALNYEIRKSKKQLKLF